MPRDVARKLILTLVVVIIVRAGVMFPAFGPAVRDADFGTVTSSQSFWLRLASVYQLTEFGLFALGLAPMLTAVILVRIAELVWPSLEEQRHHGPSGARRLMELQKYVAVGVAAVTALPVNIALLQAGGVANGGGVPWSDVALLIVNQTAGFALLWRLAELIDARGAGTGTVVIGLVWMAGAAVRALADVGELHGWTGLVGAAIWTIALIPILVLLHLGARRVPVTFAQRRGVVHPMYEQDATYIPFGPRVLLGTRGHLWALVLLISSGVAALGWRDPVTAVSEGGWFTWWGAALSIGFILVSIGSALLERYALNREDESSETLRKQGAFILGVRPGPETESYLAAIEIRLIVGVNLTFAFVIGLLPQILAETIYGSNDGFDVLAASLLPAVAAIMVTVRDINSEIMLRSYERTLG